MKTAVSELALSVAGIAFLGMIFLVIMGLISPNMLELIWEIFLNNCGITF